MNKYEQLIEAIIQENDDLAKDIFHQIVVEKSRDIYESIMEEETAEDADAEEIADEVEADEVSEAFELTAEEAKALMDYVDSGLVESVDGELLERVAQYYGVGVNEGLLSKLEESSDNLLDIAYGGVAENDDEEEADFDMDMEPEMDDAEDYNDDGMIDDHEEDHGDIEDRVFDLETAIDELQAEFDALMADENAEEEGEEEESEEGEEEGEEEESDDEMMEEESEERDELDIMREYVEKVAGVSNQEGADNKTSIVAGKNDMGGTTANIVKGSAEEKGMKAKAPKEIASGNRNVPGGKADSLEAAPKAKNETGGKEDSPLNGAPKRAK